MRITTQGEYGMRLAMDLAEGYGGPPQTVGQLAAQEELPKDYIQKILFTLKEAGIVKSTRGKNGGYRLARPPQEISIKNVIQVLERETFEIFCRDPDRGLTCTHLRDCGLRQVWITIRKNTDLVLGSVSIADLLDDERIVRQRLQSFWLAPQPSAELVAIA